MRCGITQKLARSRHATPLFCELTRRARLRDEVQFRAIARKIISARQFRVLPRNFLRDSAPVYINCEGDVLQASLQVLLNYRHYSPGYSPGAIMSIVEQ